MLTHKKTHVVFVVAQKIWEGVSEIFGASIAPNFEVVASKWLCDKRFLVLNISTSVAL